MHLGTQILVFVLACVSMVGFSVIRNYMNDSLRTDVFLRYSAETVACACIYLSARALQVSISHAVKTSAIKMTTPHIKQTDYFLIDSGGNYLLVAQLKPET